MMRTLPEGLTIRPSTDEDLEIVLALLNAYDLEYYGEIEFTREELLTDWSLPGFDHAEQARLVFDPSGQLVGSMLLNQRSFIKFYVMLRTLPTYTDPRLGSYLLELAESMARQQMGKAQPGTRVTINGWIPATNQTFIELYQQSGFKDVRHFWRMEIEMDAAPAAPVWAGGLELRPFVAERDARSVFEAMESAFADHWGHTPMDYAEWRHWTVERETFDPSLWFTAYAGERLAGAALCFDGSIGWVDTLGVLRPWRQQGLGMALLRQAFGEFYRRGRQRVGLGVDSQNLTGATRLYQRAGMHIARENRSYEKELRAGVELSTQTLPV